MADAKKIRMDAARKALAADSSPLSQEDLGSFDLKRNTALGLRESAARMADKQSDMLEQATDPFDAMRMYKRFQPYKKNFGEQGTARRAGERQTEEEYRKMVEEAAFPDEASRRGYESAISQIPQIQARVDSRRQMTDDILRNDDILLPTEKEPLTDEERSKVDADFRDMIMRRILGR